MGPSHPSLRVKQALTLVTAFVLTAASAHAQIVVEDGRVRANFGIDADAFSDSLIFGTFNQGPAGTDDWFWDGSGSGKGVIDTTGAAAFVSYLEGQSTPPGTNLTLHRAMSLPKYSASGGYLWLDAAYYRDNHSAGSAVDSSVFVGSSKNAGDPGGWSLGTGNAPSKGDIIDFYAHVRRDGTEITDSLWAFLGISTLSGDGNSYFDGEFFRSEMTYNSGGTLGNLGADSGHTKWSFDALGAPTQLGDVIAAVSFIGGGSAIDGQLYVWVNINDFPGGLLLFNTLPNRPFDFTGVFETITGGSAQSHPFGYAEIELNSTLGTVVYAEMNDTASVGPGAFGTLDGSQAQYSSVMPANKFTEFGINLTAIGYDLPNSFPGECGQLFGSVMVKTRTSASFSSALSDFAGPIEFGNVDEASVDITGDTSIDCNTSTTTLTAEVNVQSGLTFQWFEILLPGVNDTLGTSAQQTVNHAGQYWVKVTIPAGCESEDSVTVTVETAPTISNITSVSPTCAGGCTGTATAVVTGGELPYSYAWSNGQTTQTATGLCAGTYTVTVTGSNGCADTGTVTLVAPAQLSLSTIITHVTCFGQSNGAIDLSVAGGTAPFTYLWSNGTTTQDISNVPAALYSVTVTDANLCVANGAFTVTQPVLLLASALVTNVTCFGGNNGAVDLSVSGGTLPYTYLWSNGATSQDLFTLVAGTYTVTVTDANVCTATSTSVVTQPLIVTLTGTATNVSCFGGNDGAIDLSVSGGTPGFSYLWSNGATTQDITGLTAGTYVVSVTDANSCLSTKSFAVAEPPALAIALVSQTNVNCYGDATGAIDISVSGGTPAYTYSWTGPGGFVATTQDITNLIAGTYNVTVTDSKNCTKTASYTITQPSAPLDITLVSQTNVNCYGDATGAIDISVNGGTPTYTYSWTGPGGFTASTQDITNLIAGTYNVTVTDSKSCTKTASYTITQPSAPLDITLVSQTNVNCYGDATGAIDISVSGGTPAYTYSWTGPGGFVASTQDISALIAGTYNLTVTDSKSCTKTASYTITQPSAPLDITLVSQTNVNCYGDATGAIDISVSGGTPAYTYSWTGPGGFVATTQDITNLIAGTYNVTVTDSKSCTKTASYTITQPSAPLDITLVSQTNVNCYGDATGAIDISVSGGTPAYTYSWTGPGGFVASTQDITNLIAGTYNVTVTDSKSCTKTASYTITQPAAPLAITLVSQTNVNCYGDATGAIDISVSGGTPAYTYSWTGPGGFVASTQDITNLIAGTYNVTVTDSKSCTKTASYTITQPSAPLDITLVSQTNVNCYGDATGAIDISVSGGTPAYTYSWTGPGGFVASTQDIMNLIAGTYNVTVTDSKNCTKTATYTITQPSAPLDITLISQTNVNCYGDATGAIDISVSGGTPAYTYSWTGPGGFVASTQDITNLIAGTYNVTVTDSKICTKTASYTITQPSAPLDITLVAQTNVNCYGDATGAIDISVSGGTPAYTYSWTGPGGFVASTQDIGGLIAGTYNVTVTDSKSCTKTASYTITQPSAPLDITLVAQTNVNCYGDATGAIDISVSGGTPAYTYSWTGPGGFIASTQDITNLIAGTYNLTVTDSKSCTKTASYTITQPTAPLAITLVSQTNVNCYGDATGAIDISVSGGTPAYTYSWTGPGGFVETTQDITNLIAGTYNVTVTDSKNCTKTASYVITQPAAPLAITLVSQTNVNCYGDATGAIDISVSGGTPAYTYSWTGPGGFVATTQDITNLIAGTYNVTVTDSKSCTKTASYTITQPSAPLDITLVSQTNVNCYGDATGAIDISVSGGTPAYTYSWTGPGGFVATTQDITNLIAGTYNLTVTDSKNCTKTASYTITQPAAPLAITLVSQTNVNCYGDATGAIDISVSGGTPAYTYSWTGPGGFVASTQDIGGLIAGTYNVTVTDSKSCTKTASYTITQPAAPLAITLVSQTNVNCYGDATGAIDISVSGGTPAYTYSWTGPGGFVASTQDISGLIAGTYNVTVTDSKSCAKTATYTITQPAAPLAITLVSQTNVNCYGDATGAIDISVSGGTPAYTYSWTGPGGFVATTQDITNLIAGTYNVTVTDGKNCTKTASYTITQPAAPLAITLVSQTNVNCYGDATGAIDISVSGGTPAYTYSWTGPGGFVASTQDVSGLIAGTYNVTVTDSKSCTKTASYVITQPAAPLAITLVSQTNVNCYGDATGAIDISVSGGTPAYTYSWTGPGGFVATTQDITNLIAGTYNVTVTDSKNCTKTASYTITQPAAPLAITLISQTNVNCYGDATGAIDISVSGGTPAYTYSWTGPGGFAATTQDISGLIAGTYNVTVTDSKSCTKTASYTITQPTAPLAITLVNQTNVNCYGDATGAIDISVSGGTPAYTYSWTGPGSFTATTQDISGLIAGTYNVTVTDSKSCTKTASYVITQPALLVINAVVTNVSCYSGKDGAINLTITGGTLPYSFSWSNGSTTEDLTGLGAGVYSVTVSDGKGCVKMASFNVTEPPLLVITGSVTDVLCNGDDDGAINITVTGGTPPYTFQWSNGAVTEDISGLFAGTYTVTITDGHGCLKAASFTVSEPPALSLSAVIDHVSCNAFTDGAIDLTVSGGTAPYTFTWSNGALTEDLLNVVAGVYTVTVTDAHQCKAVSTFLVEQPALLDVTGIITHVSCNGLSDGAVDVTVSGGTTPYSYAWSSGSTGEDLLNVQAGTYTLTVTDVNGCTATRTFNVSEPAVVQLAASIINVSCNGLADGSVNITVTGGTAPYIYAWSNGSFSEDLLAVAAGTYNITVTDDNGCVITSAYLVTEPDALDVSAVVTNVSCNGLNDGLIDVTVSGGTTPYSYVWSTGSSLEDISGLSPGTYTLTATDAQQCQVVASYVITEPDDLVVSAAVANVSCNGLNDGSINVTVAGGTSPYTYLWSSGSLLEDLTGLTAGSYTVTVTDAHQCTETVTYVVTEPDALVLSAIVDSTTCYGAGDAAIDLSVTGGTGPYGYAWSNGLFTQDLAALTPGTYTVTVSDDHQCAATADYMVTQPDSLSMTAALTHVTCHGLVNGTIDISVTGGTAPYGFIWSNNEVTEDVFNLAAGAYSVTVTDAHQCVLSSSFDITQPDALQLSAASADVTCNGLADGSIDLTVAGGVTPYAIMWSTSDTIEDINGLSAGLYTVTVVDSHQCEAQLNVTISEPQILAIAVDSVTSASCLAGSDGSIDISITGGTEPYSFAWSNGETTEDVSGLTGGAYTVTVTDSNGCAASSVINVAVGTEITLAAAITHITCNADSSGSIVLTPTAGTPPYSYLWSDGSAGKDLIDVPAGFYTVSVTDANGCGATGFYTVLDSTMNMDVWVEASECGLETGTISVDVNGGSGNYQFLWSNGSTTSSVVDLMAGTYVVTVSDVGTGCTITRDIVVPNQDGPTIDGAVTHASCGLANGQITITVSGASGYTILWSNGQQTETISTLAAGDYCVTITAHMPNGADCENIRCFTVNSDSLAVQATVTDARCGLHDGAIALAISGTGPFMINWSTGSNQQTLTGLAAGIYLVTVSDVSTGCITTQVIEVQNSGGPDLSGTVSSDVMCAAGSDGFIDVSPSGTGPFSFLWSTGETTEDINGLIEGIYGIEVTDSSGCKAFASFIINQPRPLEALIQTGPDCPLQPASGVITVDVKGGVPPYDYAVDQPVSSLTPPFAELRAGTYNITVTDAHGCSVDGQAKISGDDSNPDCVDIAIDIPDVLTPNGDGVMDEWNILNIEEFPDNDVVIFNRWGDEVFRMGGYTNNWKGTYMDTDRILPDGTYYYVLKLNDRLERMFQGFVMIYR